MIGFWGAVFVEGDKVHFPQQYTCRECDVRWYGEDDHCWCCGESMKEGKVRATATG